MKTRTVAILFALLCAGFTTRADGLIIVHDPGPMPPVFPPPWPRPRPPRPPYVPPTRPYTFAPLEVKFHHVDVKVQDQVARTAVDQEFYNPNDRQLEGTYLFPVPAGANIDKFSMEVNGRQVEAELLDAQKARGIYEEIVRRHRDPALLEYAGRDLFKVRIFPIEPRSNKRIKLTYTQLLRADSGLTSYVYPLNTEKYSAQPIPAVSIKVDLESSRQLKSVYSPSHNVEVRRHGDNRATVGFEAKGIKPDSDFQLLFSTAEGDVGVNLLTHKTGAEEGYFLLLVTPAFQTGDRKVAAKDVSLVLDTSGSMAGKKLEQARKAIMFCVESLNDRDRFEIIRFSTEAEPLFGRLAEATRANRDRAEQFVRELRAAGGTAIHDALKKALGARPAESNRPYYVIFLTDGLPTVGETDNDKIVAMARNSGGSTAAARVFCFGIGNDVNTHLLDRITEVTRAASSYVLPDEDIEVKVSSFFGKISEPILTNVKLGFPDAVRISKLHPPSMPDLFKGEQLVLVGRYTGNAAGAITVEGTSNGSSKSLRYEARFPESRVDNDFIPRLWAARRIGYLLDEVRLRGENSELRDEITDLARKHGIITPYTAYLIHEDEQRRNVPIVMQSLPQLETDQQTRLVARNAYRSYQSDVTGGAALAAANFASSQKSANQVSEALRTGFVEAERALRASRGPAPASAAGVGGVGADAGAQLLAYAQQTRFVGGKAFYQNGNRWIDAELQKTPSSKKVVVQFGSKEYFELASKHPAAGEWLALGQNLTFLLGDAVYEITD